MRVVGVAYTQLSLHLAGVVTTIEQRTSPEYKKNEKEKRSETPKKW